MCIRARLALMFATACLSGCATVDQVTRDNVKSLAANTADFDPADVANFTNQDAQLTVQFRQLAGTVDPAADRSRAFVDAGIEYAHTRCTRYLEAAFFFNRVRVASSREIHSASSSTSALLALVKASRQLAGILPLGFDFVDQTVNNVGQGILYDLDPGIVMQLVTENQDAYVKKYVEGKSFESHAAAMNAIRGYAEQCLPVSIEGAVASKVANSQGPAPAPKESDGQQPPPPQPPSAAGSNH